MATAELCEEFDRGLTPSLYGTRCNECYNQGYLSNSVCICYGNNKDPNANCFIPFVEYTEEQLLKTKTKLECDCYSDDVNGYYKPITEGHYEEINPTVCDQCKNEVFGPKPGQNAQYTKYCNHFGWTDPNKPDDTSWYPCAGHGVWNTQTYTCRCNHGWKLNALELHGRTDSEVVYVCNECAVGYGPPVYSGNGPYCGNIWSADPLVKKRDNDADSTSEEDKRSAATDKICSGHGEMLDGECACFKGWKIGIDKNGMETCNTLL